MRILTVHPMYPTALINLMTYPVKIANPTVHPMYRKVVINPTRYLVSFPGSSAWAEKNKSGTHCLRMLSFPRISGNLEISEKICSITLTSQSMQTSPYKGGLSLTTLRVDDDEGATKVLSSSLEEIVQSLRTKLCGQLQLKRYCLI